MTNSTAPDNELSSRITHSIAVRDSEPAIPFFLAQIEVAGASDVDVTGSIIGEQDFTIWQRTPSTVSLPSELFYTPP